MHSPEHWAFLEMLPGMSNRDLYKQAADLDSIYLSNQSFKAAKLAAGCLLAITEEVLTDRVSSAQGSPPSYTPSPFLQPHLPFPHAPSFLHPSPFLHPLPPSYNPLSPTPLPTPPSPLHTPPPPPPSYTHSPFLHPLPSSYTPLFPFFTPSPLPTPSSPFLDLGYSSLLIFYF